MEKSIADRKIKELGELAKAIDIADKTSMDESLSEDVQDAAYTEYWNGLRKFAAVIVDLIHVEEKVAIRMAIYQRDKIAALVKRTAA